MEKLINIDSFYGSIFLLLIVGIVMYPTISRWSIRRRKDYLMSFSQQLSQEIDVIQDNIFATYTSRCDRCLSNKCDFIESIESKSINVEVPNLDKDGDTNYSQPYRIESQYSHNEVIWQKYCPKCGHVSKEKIVQKLYPSMEEYEYFSLKPRRIIQKNQKDTYMFMYALQLAMEQASIKENPLMNYKVIEILVYSMGILLYIIVYLLSLT